MTLSLTPRDPMTFRCAECGETAVAAPNSVCLSCAIGEAEVDLQRAKDIAEVLPNDATVRLSIRSIEAPATYVSWQGVARNVASVSEEATAAFHRQVKAHTVRLVDALDALPPGCKAMILVQDAQIKKLMGDLAVLDAKVKALTGERALGVVR